jgi:hypothetical protein
MAPRTWFAAMAIAAAMAAPAFADDAQRRRPREDGKAREAERPQEQATARQRAVPRAVEQPRREEQQRAEQARRYEDTRRAEETRRAEQARRDNESRYRTDNRAYEANRRNDNGRYDNGRYDNGRYDNNRYNNGRYATRGYTARVVRPTIIRVIPYRPYVYRPSYSVGVYYGSNGYYPYGATPRGYYDPIPGRYYGGVRITGLPRDARVFADGYYVGIVNDFDGLFQHVNLEAGPHHLEIEMGGYDAIEFDVYVRPGETTTFRGDGYFRY